MSSASASIRGGLVEHSSQPPIVRLILLAGVVGVVAGLGAVAFQVASHAVVHYGLAMLAGYKAIAPSGEAQVFGEPAPLLGGFSPLVLLAVITAGGVLSGLLVYLLAPEAEGHGTDAAIKAYHRNRGLIRPRVPIVKILASALTIGTGGSGGREGPIAQIGAGFGSFLASRLRLSDYERRILLAAGLGAGVAAIFRAPLAGAIFAIEVLYRHEDFEAEALIPAFISCTIAYVTFGLLMQSLFSSSSGFEHLFTVPGGLKFDNPLLLGPLALLALAMTGASLLYVKCFYGLGGLFRRLRMPPHLKPAVGALATGLVALAILAAMSGLSPQARHDSLSVLSFGYGVLQKMFSNQFDHDLSTALIVLLAVGLGKILTTSLTIGSGGSGGVFGPSMVIGGALGGAVGLLLRQCMPEVVTRVDVFVILGMASFFSAAAKTPVSTIIMVSELTAGYELLLPAMWVSAIAYVFSRGWTIYREQVPSRVDSPAHRGDFIVDVLEGLTIRDAVRPQAPPVLTVPVGMPLVNVMEMITRTVQTVFPVVDQDGRFRGCFSLNDIRQFLYERPMGQLAVAQDLAATDVEPLRPDTDLSSAMGRFARLPYEELPVVEDGKVTGILRRQDIIAAYNARLVEMRAGETN